MATRGVCSVCHGCTYFYCGQCGIPMHKRCFDTKYCQQSVKMFFLLCTCWLLW